LLKSGIISIPEINIIPIQIQVIVEEKLTLSAILSALILI